MDQAVRWEGQGKQLKRVVTPPSADTMKTIQTLVSTLVGLNPQRGDQLTIETLPFDTTLNMEPPEPGSPVAQKAPTGAFPADLLKNKPVMYGVIAGGVLMLGVIVMGVLRGRRRKAEAAEETPVLPPSAAAVNLQLPMDGSRALMASRTEALLAQLQENAKANPEAWATVLRGWLSEEGS